MEKEYCVKFIRCDDAIPPLEIYYYNNLKDAELQFNIFKSDDPDFPAMYKKIQLIVMCKNLSTVVEEINYHKNDN